jgi:glutamate-ammonia-ligase adenylyltransferase
MIEDRQTHTLPDGEALGAVARLDGHADGAAYLAHLRGVCAPVAAAYDALLAQGEGPRVYPVTLNVADPHGLAPRIARWSGEHYRVLRSEAADQAFEAVRSQLVVALLAAPDPARAVTQFETLLTRMPSVINLFRLLEARPPLFDLLMRILSLAPPLAEQLSQRPNLIDPLIDRSALDLPGSVDDLAERMRRAARDASYEARLDGIRIVTGEVRFALGVQLIEAAHDPLAIGAALGRLAEAGLREAQAAAEQNFAAAHGVVPGGELVVLALGRVGGGVLTHASDLDLVYLFTGDFDRESIGPRPLGATLYFNRLASRLSAALSVPTAEGALYEVDTRLRPQGTKGPLAASVDSFRRYQAEDAWTWEHMALTRGRPVTGSDAARQAVAQVIAEVLGRPRDPAKLLADVLSMRGDMARHKPPAGPLDVKNLRGGLVDVEFLVHFLQLRERRFVAPDLSTAIQALSGAGLLDAEMVEAHAVLNRVLIAARLLAPDLVRPHPAAAERLAAACGADSYDALCQDIARSRASAACEWTRITQQELEIT